MAGYSGTPLEKKLGLADRRRILLDCVPSQIVLDLPAAALIVRRSAPDEALETTDLDFTLTCHTTISTLAQSLPACFAHTRPDGMVWVAWPKKAAHKRLTAAGMPVDLTEDRIREFGLQLGWVDVKVCAIDETWSGLKFVQRLRDRPAG